MVKACPICRSRKWRKDAITGNAVCEEGHVYQDFRSENLVVENANFTLQRRAKRTGPRKNKRREEGRANEEYLHGSEAEWLKVQAMQLLLRYQTQELKKLSELPDVFETIVRDLWTYQLAISPIPDPPRAPGNSPSPMPETSQPKPAVPTQTEDAGSSSDSSRSSDNDQDAEEAEKEERELLAESERERDLLAEISEDEEEGGPENVEELQKLVEERQRFQQRRRVRRLNISDTIVTIALALWILRVPIMMVDLESLINDNRIPYLDFAHTTLVPDEMRRKMNHVVRAALAPTRAPRPLYLFELMRHFARTLVIHYGVKLPEVNIHPLSWRIVSTLGGRPSVYRQVHALLALIDTNLSLWTDFERVYRQQRYGPRMATDDDGGNDNPIHQSRISARRPIRYKDVIMPDIAVAAAWLCVMKMTYGLDGEDRTVRSEDRSAGTPRAADVVKNLELRQTDGKLKGTRKHLEKQNFSAMKLEDIDLYLDQCEKVLLNHHPGDTEAGPFTLMPSSGLRPSDGVVPEWNDHHNPAPQHAPAPLPDPDGLVPGEQYVSWDAQDFTGTLPNTYETVLNAASDVIGVSKWEIADVVELFDRRLMKVWRKKYARSRSRSRSSSRSSSRRNSGPEAQTGSGNETPPRMGQQRDQSHGVEARNSRSRSKSRERPETQNAPPRSERIHALRERVQRAASNSKAGSPRGDGGVWS